MAEIDPLIANDDLPPSKSELKRQMAERQKLAEALSTLTSDALKSIPIDEDLRDAIAETSRVRSFEGIRRHKQYLGKRMRALSDEDRRARAHRPARRRPRRRSRRCPAPRRR